MSQFAKKFENMFMRVGLQEQILFARHLSIMSKAGISLLDSLTLLKKQAKSKTMRNILGEAANDVSNGQFLSDALQKFENVFGDLFLNIVRIGETSGTLPENLNYLAAELAKKRTLRGKIHAALIYPVIILIATSGILALLLGFVFPKILPVFQSLNATLPLPTRMLIAAANFMQDYTLLVFATLTVVIILFVAALRVRKIKFWYHRFLLAAPTLGTLIQNVNMANFCRTLGILLKSGSPIVEAVSITARTLTNLPIRASLQDVSENIKKGQQISKHLITKPKLFPLMLTQMLEVGENTGNLSDTLLYLADYYEEEIDNATKGLATMLEPLLLVIMGVIVGFVALAIITPIYGITQHV